MSVGIFAKIPWSFFVLSRLGNRPCICLPPAWGAQSVGAIIFLHVAAAQGVSLVNLFRVRGAPQWQVMNGISWPPECTASVCLQVS